MKLRLLLLAFLPGFALAQGTPGSSSATQTLTNKTLVSPVVQGSQTFNPAPSTLNSATVSVTTNGTNSSSYVTGAGATHVGSASGGALCPPAFVTAGGSTTYYGSLVTQGRLGDWQFCSGYTNPIYAFLGMNTTINQPAVFYMIQGGATGNGLYVQTLTQGSSCSSTLTFQPSVTTACTSMNGDPQNLGVPFLLTDGFGTIGLSILNNATTMYVGDTGPVNVLSATSSGSNDVLVLGDSTNTASTTKIQADGAAVALTNGAAAITGTTTINGQSATYAEMSVSSFFNAPMTLVTGPLFGFTKFVKASTLDNFIVSAAIATSCAPVVAILECGTSTTCASPTTMASVTLSAAQTATPATISSSAIAAGDYIAFQSSAASCATVDGFVSAQVHSN